MTADDRPDVIEPRPDGSVPDGYVLCDDGKLYRKRIVAGIHCAVGDSTLGPRQEERVEQAMADAINAAVAEGVSVESAEMAVRVNAARIAATKREQE